ncbi:MAG: FTR1 family protein [Candidatus Marinimicrobia bacterium]|nr:FTR1 family protein [Candidatus Neomarinimicrobiota bacterium]
MGLSELLITFRETLEAALVIGILYTFLIKADRIELIQTLWKGVGMAIIASVVAAVLFQLLAGGFTGRMEKIIEGTVMILAALILSTMIIWMAKNRNVAEKLEHKAESALTGRMGAVWGIFLLSFVAVFREGIETVLFLYGIAIKEGGLSLLSSLFGGAVAVGIGYLIFLQGKRMPLKTFFNVSSVLLILVVAGLLAHGIHEFEKVGIIPYHGAVWDINPARLVDGRFPLLHEKGAVGSIMAGLFGWNGNPSLTEVLSWLAAVTCMGFLWRRAATS